MIIDKLTGNILPSGTCL